VCIDILIDRALGTYIGTRGATGVLSPKIHVNTERERDTTGAAYKTRTYIRIHMFNSACEHQKLT
jgi:hypothetical protein